MKTLRPNTRKNILILKLKKKVRELETDNRILETQADFLETRNNSLNNYIDSLERSVNKDNEEALEWKAKYYGLLKNL